MLNNKEYEVFEFIKSRLSCGISPSVREIMDAAGFKSTSTAHRYINALVDAGVLEKTGNINRSLRLPNSDNTFVPIIGTVTAGQPITAFEDITGYVSCDPRGCDPQDLFALKVRGESMINKHIIDGDIVIVEKRSYAENGEIIVALVDGSEATVKTFYKENGHFRLQPENDTMDPIILDEVEILGKVIGLKRDID
jgi:repressor LexA